MTGRVNAAWPSFALIGSYELLIRQVRRPHQVHGRSLERNRIGLSSAMTVRPSARPRSRQVIGRDVRRQAWEWAVANKAPNGSLPNGKVIGDRYGRHERWGRLVKNAGAAGEFT
jgi:hypothetical protein